MDADALVDRLGLAPHPEGGFYRETFRSAQSVAHLTGGERSAVTSILFLLPAGAYSAWHRVRSDELWYHHEGGPLDLHLLDTAGHRVVRLGSAADGLTPHAVVPAGTWQAARPIAAAVLCGCAVAPGFTFEDFALADPSDLPPVPDEASDAVRSLLPRSSGAA